MKFLSGLTVLVLGLGDSGLAMARWCARCGATVRVWDSREAPPHAAALAEHLPSAELLLGALTDSSFDGAALILKSPGLAPNDVRIKAPLSRAMERGLLVQGEIELFAHALADLKLERGYAPKVIAITGTNGKTTTASMAATLIERAGKRVALAGNIGPTMLQTLSDALDLEPEAVACELELEAVRIQPEANLNPVRPALLSVHPELLSVRPEPVEGPLHRELVERPEPVEGLCAALASTSSARTEVGVSVRPELLSVRPEPVEGPVHCELVERPEPVEGLYAALASAGRSPAFTPELGEGSAPTDVEVEVRAELEVQLDSASNKTGADTPFNSVGQLPPGLIPPPPPGPTFVHLPEVWVLELSSFQLHEAKGFEPSSAAVLNISQDHLDWHGDMPAYVAAKARVFGQQAVMVINRDDPAVAQMVPKPPQPERGKSKVPKWVPRAVVRFGLNAPEHPGDYGLITENGMAWLVRAMETDETIKAKRGAVLEEDIVIQRLMPADALRVRGRHNAANALAALALATSVGCALAPMLHGLREYSGEPHRVQHVATIDGIDAFDDSKGTNVGATVAAINGLGADRSPSKLLLILGGDGKGQDFSVLLPPIAQHARCVATIGRDAPAIESALAAAGVPLKRHDSLEAATRWAFQCAQAGDAVLLSPACASLDMFRNYAHRAEVFVQTVHDIAQDRGLT